MSGVVSGGKHPVVPGSLSFKGRSREHEGDPSGHDPFLVYFEEHHSVSCYSNEQSVLVVCEERGEQLPGRSETTKPGASSSTVNLERSRLVI